MGTPGRVFRVRANLFTLFIIKQIPQNQHSVILFEPVQKPTTHSPDMTETGDHPNKELR